MISQDSTANEIEEMSLREQSLTTLRAYQPLDSRQRDLRNSYIAHIEAYQDAFEKKCPLAHITVSALLLNHTKDKALLTLHPKVGRWLQLGGHCEANDSSLLDGALREAREESGLSILTPVQSMPIQLDAHTINCRGDGLVTHLDLQFAFIADPSEEISISGESLELRWFPMTSFPNDCDLALINLAANTAQLLS